MKKIHLIPGLLLLCGLCASAQKKTGTSSKKTDAWAMIPPGNLVFMSGDSLPVAGFWLYKTEISNREYREFVISLFQEGDTAQARAVLPDTLVWRRLFNRNEPYVEYYFRHPAYDDYPVVGISHEAAGAFCVWLTQKISADPGKRFAGRKPKYIEVRLPTETEWIWAAKGGHRLSPYPWGGPYLRNSRGDFLCNFSRPGEENITRNIETGEPEIVPVAMRIHTGVAGRFSDGADITAPVRSYYPNGYGLYNMAGNVAEMTARPGNAKGGSWFTGGYDAQIEAPDPNRGNAAPASYIGFRPLLTVIFE